jgi:CRP/FNR family transcriptional regulator, cyclic AMP receptor protein
LGSSDTGIPTGSDHGVTMITRSIISRHASEKTVPKGQMVAATTKSFNLTPFLSTAGAGRRIIVLKARAVAFSQGQSADSVFYMHAGRGKLTVVSKRGKEATVTLLAAGDFFGEEAMAGPDSVRTSTARAIVACKLLRIERLSMLRVLHEEREFAEFFMKFILLRSARTQADLIDQLFNSSERRLARTLLLMAEFGQPGEPATLLPAITQEALAELIGTTRSRVSFFMNRFRRLGYIDYNGRIRVHKSLLDVVLHDRLPEENASRPKMLDPLQSPARDAGRAKLV